MLSFLEMFSFDMVSELLSVVITFVAQFALEILAREAFQDILQPSLLIGLAHIWNSYFLAQFDNLKMPIH